MRYILTCFSVVLFVANAHAQDDTALKEGAGKEAVERHCATCHSLDYLRINTPFLNNVGWETEVTKMIKAYGAPIEAADAKIIIDYLAKNYGTGG